MVTPRIIQETLDGFGASPTAPGALGRLEVPPGDPLMITLTCNRVACKCPITGQDDWGVLHITYEPGKWLVETVSLQKYLETFEEVSIIREALVQHILTYFVEQIEPMTCDVRGVFKSEYSPCTQVGLVMDVSAGYYKSYTPVTRLGKIMPDGSVASMEGGI